MKRLFPLAILSVALVLPACSSQGSEQEAEAPPPPPPPLVIPPPPPAIVDVLPEFKKNSRAFLDLAKKLHKKAAIYPPPVYAEFWKEYVPLEEVYGKVIANEPKSGPAASAFERINKIRDSLFKTQLTVKNTEELNVRQVTEKLEAEAGKRAPYFEEAEFFWKQTPEKGEESEISPYFQK